MPQLGLYTATENELGAVQRAAGEVDADLVVRSESDLDDEPAVEAFVDELTDADAVILWLHGAEDSMPGYDLAVERVGDRQRAYDAVPGRAERKCDERNRPGFHRWVRACAAVLALFVGAVRGTAVGAVRDRALLGQQVGKRAHRRRLRCPLLAADQQAGIELGLARQRVRDG